MNELLKQLIESLGISRSQFAKNINMDRSQVVKTINGNMPVSKRFYTAIMAAPFIRDDFKDQFAAEYNKGVAVTYHRKVIDRFCFNLTAPRIALRKDEFGNLIYSSVKNALTQKKTVFAITTHEHVVVNHALQYALKETGAKSLIRINPITRVLCEETIDDLFDIAEYACLGVQTYVTEEPFNGLLPFGVFSEGFAVVFDGDGNYTVIRDERTCLSLVQKYERLSSNLPPSVVFTEDEADTLLRNQDYNFGSGAVYLYNHFSPIGIVDKNMLVSASNPDLNDTIRQNLAYATAKEYEQRAAKTENAYYTTCAIEDFVRSGRIAAITERYLQPFSVPIRIEMLKRLCCMVKNEKVSIIKTDSLRYSGDIAINNIGIDLCICGRQSLRSDLYCVHFYLLNDRIQGLEGLAKELKSSLPTRQTVMSQIGAEYYINSLIASLDETSGSE